MPVPEKFEFDGLTIHIDPRVPEGHIGIIQTGRSYGKSAFIKQMSEGQPEFETRSVELKGDRVALEMVVWPWIEREFGG